MSKSELQKELPGDDVKRRHPRDEAGIFSLMTISWVIPIIRNWNGDEYSKKLPDPPKGTFSSYLRRKASRIWNWEREKKKNPSLMRTLMKQFVASMIVPSLLMAFLELVLKNYQSILLGDLINYFSEGTLVTFEQGHIYALLFTVCTLAFPFFVQPVFLSTMYKGILGRMSASTLIYDKVLKLKLSSFQHHSPGHVINLISNDVGKLDVIFVYLPYLVIAPLQISVVAYLLWLRIGIAAAIGLGLMFLLIPFKAASIYSGIQLEKKKMVRADCRIRLVNEFITGIQVIKMCAWEKPFTEYTLSARRKEISTIRKINTFKGLIISHQDTDARLGAFAAILYIVLTGQEITSQKIFVAIALFEAIKVPFAVLVPVAIYWYLNAQVSCKRIENFLKCEEINRDKSEETEKDPLLTNGVNHGSTTTVSQDATKPQEVKIIVENATAKWDPDTPESALLNISTVVEPGHLTFVVGSVGAGKTSFLLSLLNELPLTSGSIQVTGSVSYASQKPWLFQATVRENIVFNSPWDPERYQQVIRVCALKRDLELLPNGEMTVVSERGADLSGGQQARINLARAIYRKADIYLLDDPLAAVDTKVGLHIFRQCIQDYLKGKTVILVTHQKRFFQKADQIYLMESGSIKAKGTYTEILESGHQFENIVTQKSLAKMKAEPGVASRFSLEAMMSSTRSLKSSSSVVMEEVARQLPDDPSNEETMGSVSWGTYKFYCTRAVHIFFVFLLFFLFFLGQAGITSADFWLMFWTSHEETKGNWTLSGNQTAGEWYIYDRTHFVYIFSGLTAAGLIACLCRALYCYNICTMISNAIHNTMLISVIKSTMAFFHKNNSGRILNRFSRDIGITDENLPDTIYDVNQGIFTVAALAITLIIINPWMVILLGSLIWILYRLCRSYFPIARTMKNLESSSRSPIYAHTNATIQGLATIRAFGAESIMIKRFDEHQDRNTSSWYTAIGVSRAFGYWIEVAYSFFTTAILWTFMGFDLGMSGSKIGLSFSQIVTTAGLIQWVVRRLTDMDSAMVSVERIREYSSLKSEEDNDVESVAGRPWGDKGEVVFKNVYLRYSEGGNWALKAINLKINRREKIGIVGRTGSGKSSLISTIFRLANYSGHIEIDGVDIATVPLSELRSKISVIPQDPVLFTGTLRTNLDPYQIYQDSALWEALEEVYLKDEVKNSPFGLDYPIIEGGSNLSVGQRQLVCLARAFVRKNKILVFDEATANIDPSTDMIIQQMLRKKFVDCTMITVAHRLDTIIDCDKVVVMSSGSILEYDHPHTLLQNPNGQLYSMVQQSGSSRSTLVDMAAQSFRRLKEEEKEKET